MCIYPETNPIYFRKRSSTRINCFNFKIFLVSSGNLDYDNEQYASLKKVKEECAPVLPEIICIDAEGLHFNFHNILINNYIL